MKRGRSPERDPRDRDRDRAWAGGGGGDRGRRDNYGHNRGADDRYRDDRDRDRDRRPPPPASRPAPLSQYLGRPPPPPQQQQPAQTQSQKEMDEKEKAPAAAAQDEGYDDKALAEIERFLGAESDEEEEEDEEAKLERLAAERKKRREQIVQQKQQEQAQAVAVAPSLMADAAVAAAAAPAAIPAPPDESQLEAERVARSEAEASQAQQSAVLDMFSDAQEQLLHHQQHGHGLGLGLGLAAAEGEDPLLQSNWDDAEGYYKARMGEVICGHYQTVGVLGKGVFATVLKCLDLRVAPGPGHGPATAPAPGTGTGAGATPSSDAAAVAIKLIRNNDTMRKAADRERAILQSIAARDPAGKRFCVRLLEALEFRSHVALVFEYQAMNLREALRKFGKDVGINIGAVRMYARQLFVALQLLAELRVVHADIKLDNILCSGDLRAVKLCDFGSAFRETDTDNTPTPYLVSRFYRAPEIILGLPYDRQIDLWSVAVCLYELFTGRVMFAGRSNNEMLRLIMAVKGRMPMRLVKQHQRQYETLRLEAHFDNDGRFKLAEVDALTGKAVVRVVDAPAQPVKDLGHTLLGSKAGSDDGRMVSQLADLLDKCLALDPTRRPALADVLAHPFFSVAA